MRGSADDKASQHFALFIARLVVKQRLIIIWGLATAAVHWDQSLGDVDSEAGSSFTGVLGKASPRAKLGIRATAG